MRNAVIFAGLSRIPLANSSAPSSSSLLFNSRNTRGFDITLGLQRTVLKQVGKWEKSFITQPIFGAAQQGKTDEPAHSQLLPAVVEGD
jgi:hypothetical protein